MSRPATITVHAPLLSQAEVRHQRDQNPAKPGVVLLIVTMKRPTDALPCVAQLQVGAACASTFHVAHQRAGRLRAGAMVRVEAEGFTVRQAGRGRTSKAEALVLLGVREICADSAAPTHDPRLVNDERYTQAA
ncbi:hypothetical protein LNV47_22595 [Paucibacter sp. DJ4R-1]|nr:hypothetical protein [Paucibacter sp. DJ4R-1]